jgi:Ni,Fe-hydrogenase III component G
MSYIPKQEKRTRERVEAKLDRELIRKLEQYCTYLDSDRDYVIGKALEIAFDRDKAFIEWLKSQTAETFKLTAPKAADAGAKGRS